MSLIMYGGDRNQVLKQLACNHYWHGPCMDRISRYYKCTKCYCIQRDVDSLKEYYEVEAREYEGFESTRRTISDA